MSNLDCVLAGLAERIDTLHSASLSSHRKSIEQAIECGRALAGSKGAGRARSMTTVARGEHESGLTHRARWMRFAKNADAVLSPNASRVRI